MTTLPESLRLKVEAKAKDGFMSGAKALWHILVERSEAHRLATIRYEDVNGKTINVQAVPGVLFFIPAEEQR